MINNSFHNNNKLFHKHYTVGLYHKELLKEGYLKLLFQFHHRKNSNQLQIYDMQEVLKLLENKKSIYNKESRQVKINKT